MQHANYVQTLKDLGLEVMELEADEKYPDSCFVEDNALMTPNCIIVANPGAPTRKGEIENMLPVLKQFHDNVEFITDPGTCEPGDIMMVDKHFYIGQSDRTNKLGAEQMIAHLEKHGLAGSIVKLDTMLHLKTGCNYLQNNVLLVAGEFKDDSIHPEFSKFNKIEVDDDEAYACNSVWVNGTVIVPAGFPKVLQRIKDAGYGTVEVDVSEFMKLDGGLSCLSLRF